MAISIPIISDFNARGIDSAVAQFKRLETTGQKAQFALQKAAGPAAAALAGLAAGAGFAVKKASDLQETASKVGQIFGESNKDIERFARDAAKNIGQSQKAALDAAATFGTFGKAAGLAGGDLSNFAIKFTTLATDLASFNNTNPEDAVQALGAALRGESEPIRRYGVLLNDAAIKQQALEMGLINTTKKALDPQTRALATARIIMKQTADQQGDFARTSDGLAGQLKILKAQVEDLATEFGTALLPIAETLTTYLVGLASVVEDNAPLFGALATAIGIFSTAIFVANGALKAWRTIAAITTGINFALGTSFTAVQVATGVGIATAIAGAAAFMSIKRSMDKARDSALQYTGAIDGVISSQEELNNFQGPVASRNLQELRTFQAKYQASLIDTGSETDKVKDKTKELAAGLRDKFGEALKTAQDKLADAREEFKAFAAGVSTSIKQAFNFGAAQGTAAENARTLADALAERAKAQAEVNKLVGTDDTERLKEAQTDLAKAIDAVTAAQKKPMTFFDELTVQANKTKTFGELVNRLLAAGLKEPALQQVLDAGVDAGTAIAKEILGSADGVLKANNLTQEMQTIADGVGKTAAEKFRQAGVTQGQALVDGIQSIVNNYRIKLSSKGLNAKQLKRLSRDFSIDVEFAMSSGIPALADGGIVTGPQIALIGEQGPEAVIPLDRMGSMGNVTINVNGGDPEAVVQALRRYMNRYGNIPIRTVAP